MADGIRISATVPLARLACGSSSRWAPHPAEILCWNSRRAWKVTESDFPQEESLKVIILTGGVSAKLAGRAFRLDENTVPRPNVAKTLGLDPPPYFAVASGQARRETKS